MLKKFINRNPATSIAVAVIAPYAALVAGAVAFTVLSSEPLPSRNEGQPAPIVDNNGDPVLQFYANCIASTGRQHVTRVIINTEVDNDNNPYNNLPTQRWPATWVDVHYQSLILTDEKISLLFMAQGADAPYHKTEQWLRPMPFSRGIPEELGIPIRDCLNQNPPHLPVPVRR